MRTAGHIHAVALVIRDGATVHEKLAFITDICTVDIVNRSVRRIGDGAAVHSKGAAIQRHANAGWASHGNGSVIQRKLAPGDINAILIFAFIRGHGDSALIAVVLAIGQSEVSIVGIDLNDAAGIGNIFSCDRVAVETQGQAAGHNVRAGQRHVLSQVIRSTDRQRTITDPGGKGYALLRVAAHIVVGGAAQVVRVGLHSQHQQTIAVADLISIIIAGELFFVSLAQCRT